MQDNKVILTFDLEFWHEGEWMEKYLSSNNYLKDYLEESVSPLLDCLYKYKAKATFFITGKVVDKYPELIKKIYQAGHEISSHGFSHRNLNTFSPLEFEKESEKLIELIRNVIDKKPKGFRAPSFSLNNQTRWVLPILSKQGFQYDSSVFPVKTPLYGIANAPDYVYKISFADVSKIDQNSPLIEVPLTVYSFGRIRIPIAGGIYFRLIPLCCYKKLLKKRIIHSKSMPILYFHPHELCTETPVIKSGPWLRRKLKYFGIKNNFKKLEKLLQTFSFDSVENVLKL